MNFGKRLLIIIGLAGVIADLGRAPSSQGEPTLQWESVRVKAPPEIDGEVDSVWSEAVPLLVPVREAFGGGAEREVKLKALHTSDTLYVLAEWSDDTRSDMRDPYIWNQDKKDYDRPSRPDDQFALEFPLSGAFSINMLTVEAPFSADVWHWKAGRGNPIGWVDDKTHAISQEPLGDGAMEYSLGGHETVYIARRMDEGEQTWVLVDKPKSNQGDIVDSYRHREPTASLADVRGKGVHNGAGWTLEMNRAFNTGHPDDAVINPASGTRCAIAVLDDELYWEHSVSQQIELRFRGR